MTKKSICITNGAVEYLYSILATEHAHDKKTMKKLQVAFSFVTPVRKAFQDAGKAIKLSFEEPKEVSAPDGTKTMKKVIPAERMDEYNEKLEECSDAKSTVEMDRETMAFVKNIVDNVFSREDLKGGLNGPDQVEMYTEVSGALDAVMGVKEDKNETEDAPEAGTENGAAPADGNAEAGTDVATA